MAGWFSALLFLVIGQIALGEGTVTNPGCLTTPSRPDKEGNPSKGNTPCIFPFTFKSKTYHNCAPGTALSDLEDDQPWCSTKVDSRGRHVSGEGEWGFCSESCAVNCTSSEFTCANRNQCIRDWQKCNGGKPDCQDGSDEGTATCGCFGGISCCSQGFTPGDNNGDGGEYFIQASEYLTNCQVSCKTKFPTGSKFTTGSGIPIGYRFTGITESIVETYSSGDGKNKNKCWCEFGPPKLDSSSANYQTCVFPQVEGVLGNRWIFNGGTTWLGFSRPSELNGTECCELCRKEHPTTEFFNLNLEFETSVSRPVRSYHLCSCLGVEPDVPATTYYQHSFTQYCGTNETFEAGVEGGLGDGRVFSHGTAQFSVAGDDVTDRSQCCEKCNEKEGCALILYKKTPGWGWCWYYKTWPGSKVATSVPRDEFRLTGSCGATSGYY